MLVFDIGAHLGEDTEYYLARGFNVIAFECMPENIKRIQDKFPKEILCKRLILETRALLAGGGEDREATFFVDEISFWGTLHKDWAERNQRLGSQNRSISVKTMDPREAYDLYGKPYFIKIDIEGEDVNVLKSLSSIRVQERPKYISIESSKTSWKSLINEFRIFEDLGYTHFAVRPQSKMAKTITQWVASDGKKYSFKHQKDSSGPFGGDLDKSAWMSKRQAIRKYKIIFIWYFLFGDDGILAPRKIKNIMLRRKYSRLLNRLRLKDWYDTHAKREEQKR